MDEEEPVEKEPSKHGVVLSAFVVIFLAERRDLAQILSVRPENRGRR